MTDKNFSIMLENGPWAGPNATTLSGPDFMIDDGVYIDDKEQSYEISLAVDKQAENPVDFPPCDIHRLDSGFMFSKRFIDLLAQLNVDNIQYFDTKVTLEPGGEQLQYKAANIVGKVMGLDMENSEVRLTSKGSIMGIMKMKFDESKMQGHKIFRLQERVMLVVVHKSIKEAVENAGLTGFMFVSDDEYEPSMI